MADNKFTGASERMSALINHFAVGQYGKVGPPGVTLREVPNLTLHQLTAWHDTADRVLNRVCKVAGLAESPHGLMAVVGESACVLPVGPLKWWLLGVEPFELTTEEGFILDLSQSRTCLQLCGPQASALLNRHLSLDLRDKNCTVNSVQSSSFDHVAVTVWRRQHGFDLFLPRSFAVALFALLCETAEQFGYELLSTDASHQCSSVS